MLNNKIKLVILILNKIDTDSNQYRNYWYAKKLKAN